jgi:hypothetical protein
MNKYETLGWFIFGMIMGGWFALILSAIIGG